MKLIKVRDNQNRPVSTLDIMIGSLFGGSIPREFISGEYYQAGERVYKIESDGCVKVYECALSGTYLRCEDPGFSEWSLNSIISKYSDTILSLKNSTSDPVLYKSKSLLVPIRSYGESNGKAKFVAKTDSFDLNDYSGLHDIVDVYLRREHSDSYISPSEYEFDGEYLSIEVPVSDLELTSNHKTVFFPEGLEIGSDGRYKTIPLKELQAEEFPELLLNIDGKISKYIVVAYDESRQPHYWYGENGLTKTYPFTDMGISLLNFDVLTSIGKPADTGYKICDLKIDAIHTVVESPLNGLQDTEVLRLDEFLIGGNHKTLSSELPDTIQSIDIPVDVEPTRNLTDILHVTLDTEKQVIHVSCDNGHIKQIRFSLTAKKLKPLSAFIIGTKANSDLTRFINVTNEYGTIVEINDSKYIKFPRFDLLRYNSFDFELYHNRVFTSHYDEYINEDGELFIKMLDESVVDYDNDKFLFHIFYSISQGAAIARTSDTNEVMDDKDAFRIFLTTEFINKFQWLKLREDYKVIPPEVTVGSKTNANITNPDYYLDIGKKLRADVFSVIFKDIANHRRDGSMTDGCNSESYPILKDTREFTIPFIDYDAEKDDFLIFKSGGILLSSTKWYLNGDNVSFYAHEYPLHNGDYIDFRLLDRDENIRIYNKFLTGTSDAQESMYIGTDISSAPFFLLFTTSGQFISPSKYTIDGSKITFNKNCNQPFVVDNGTRLEAIYGVFKGPYCKTVYTTGQFVATEDNQKEFDIDKELDFNSESDNVLIFREDGMYIGERFYHMSEENDKIIIDKGTGVPKGSHIDVVIIRNLTKEITVS